MNIQSLHPSVTASIATLSLAFSIAPTLQAEEGGGGHVAPGGVGTLIDAAPTKSGWVLEAMFIHYKGDFSAKKQLPIGGLLSLGMEATSDTLNVGALYTFEEKLWGAHYSAGMFLPYTWLDLKGNIHTTTIKDSAQGIGDISLIPAMLAWKKDNWQYSASLSVYAPTGDYNAGDVANLGLNYWTVDPTVGVIYANEKTGFNASVYTGITFNSENSATDYKSGSMFHLEASVQQLLPLGPGFIGLGADAFFFQQVSSDSGSGARSSFKGETSGIGPVVNYILPYNDKTWVFEAKWLPELNTENRLEGDFIWLKAVCQF